MANPNRLTAQQCVDLIEAETGSKMSAATFRVYAHRGQAPAAVERISNTPLWKRSEVLEWAKNRPGAGSRTDLRKTRRRTKDSDDAE